MANTLATKDITRMTEARKLKDKTHTQATQALIVELAQECPRWNPPSTRALAVGLNSMGWLTRRRYEWTQATVAKFIRTYGLPEGTNVGVVTESESLSGKWAGRDHQGMKDMRTVLRARHKAYVKETVRVIQEILDEAPPWVRVKVADLVTALNTREHRTYQGLTWTRYTVQHFIDAHGVKLNG